MKKAAAEAAYQWWDDDDAQELREHVRAIDVDEVLAWLPPAPDPVARLVEAGIDLSPWISASMSDPYNPACAEYLRVAEAFLSALAAMETNHDH